MSGLEEAISPSSIRSVRPVRGSALPVWQVASTADLLVVGPATFDADPPAPVLTTRQRVLAASQRAGISLIDPIRQGWLQERDGGLVGEDGVHAPHGRVADRILPGSEG